MTDMAFSDRPTSYSTLRSACCLTDMAFTDRPTSYSTLRLACFMTDMAFTDRPTSYITLRLACFMTDKSVPQLSATTFYERFSVFVQKLTLSTAHPLFMAGHSATLLFSSQSSVCLQRHLHICSPSASSRDRPGSIHFIGTPRTLLSIIRVTKSSHENFPVILRIRLKSFRVPSRTPMRR